MATFRRKYNESETVKRGVDRILKSDQYTEEYKKVILDMLGTDYSNPKPPATEDMEFDLLKSGSLVITTNSITGSSITITEKPAAVTGFLEKPKYLEDALTKAVDVDVDELISPGPEQKPETVPKDIYDDLRIQYNQSISDLEDLRDQLNEKISELETAEQEIQLLNQTVDSEKLLRASADNQTQASNNRYIVVLKDFQIAMQKGIQEAIERVSLTAQVRGLQAQKEVLKEQLKQMTVIVKNLQQSVEESADLLSDQQEAQAASLFVGGVPGSFAKTTDSGWKIPEGNIGTQEIGKYPLYYQKDRGWRHGTTIDFYNLTEEVLIFTFTYVKKDRVLTKGGNQSQPFIGVESSITVGPRVESKPGKTSVEFRKLQIFQTKFTLRARLKFATDIVKVQVSNGDSYEIGAYYNVKS